MTRTVALIEREIKDAETKASDPTLKGNGIFSAEQQRRLYHARAEALRAELDQAERARQAILRVAQKGTT